jgi:hypothetical protein
MPVGTVPATCATNPEMAVCDPWFALGMLAFILFGAAAIVAIIEWRCRQ